MARFRVYIKPFDRSGNYVSEYIEVTQDVISIKSISQQLDASDYNVGVFRNGNFSFVLKNDKGYYSEETNLRSMFRYKRSDSLVKITWDFADYDLIAGFFSAGDYLGQEIEVFEGLLSDLPAQSIISEQSVEFGVLGFETLFDRAIVPFSTITVF